MCNRMIVRLVWILFSIFCLRGIHAKIRDQNRCHPSHPRCLAARAYTALEIDKDDIISKQCTAVWTEFQDAFTTIDPHLAFEIRGIEACKMACFERIPGCVAIDVYPNVTLCIYHLRPTRELAENRFTALEPGYKQLILNRSCSFGQTDQKQLQHPAANNGKVLELCTIKWIIVHGVHSAGYHTHLGVYGEDACKRDCISNIPGCVGIEIVKRYESCNYFIQPIEQLVKIRVPLEGYTQHILTRECHPFKINNTESDQQVQPFITSNSTSKACTANWTKIPDVISLLYRRHPTAYGREECQKVCFESIPGCVAISMLEIDEIPLHKVDCFYFLEPLSQVMETRMPLKGSAQYVLSRECPSDSQARINETDENAVQDRPIITLKSCTAKWTEVPGMCSIIGDSEANTEDEQDCKKACFDTPECVAVDVRENVTESCYYHLQALEEVTKDRRPINECSQFVLTRECRDSELTKECTWEENKDIYSFGAKLNVEITGIEACKTACIEKIPGCVAVDYHASPFCWYHSDKSNFTLKRQSFPGRGFIQYVRNKLC